MKRLLTFLDGIGSIGALFAAIAAPCCFPLFAGVIAAVGLGALGRSEGFALYALQGFALLSLFGLALGVRQNGSPWPFILGVASVVVLAWSFYGKFSQSALYGGLFGLLAATVWNRLLARSRVRSAFDQPSCSSRTSRLAWPSFMWKRSRASYPSPRSILTPPMPRMTSWHNR
jgi:MerC mercury resistance protein